MQCDECGKELKDEHGCFQYLQIFGFYFCITGAPGKQFVSVSICRENFERKLWEQAQANKQAEREAESKTPEASGNQGQMVAGSTSEWQTP